MNRFLFASLLFAAPVFAEGTAAPAPAAPRSLVPSVTNMPKFTGAHFTPVEPLLIKESNKGKAVLACAPLQKVLVQGNNNTLELTGECSTIVVEGDKNTLTFQSATAIHVTGKKNQFHTTGEPPAFTSMDESNRLHVKAGQ
jgi:hypothetical protein